MQLSLKVGSILKIPFPAIASISSSDPSVLSASSTGNVATISALKPGQVNVIVHLAPLLSWNLAFAVTPT